MNRRDFMKLGTASAATLAASDLRAQTPVATPFPASFVWGAAAASYQIEGAPAEDGKGPSIWDMFCKKPGSIWRDQSGDLACDHYHRYKEDVALMKAMGLEAYRLSVSWPRVMPDGTGAVNAK